MWEISAEEVIERIRVENPWWAAGPHVARSLHPRAYFQTFLPLVKDRSVRRALVLMGPRRVGKTVMIHHAIDALLKEGVSPRRVCYFSVDHPIYNGLSLEKLLGFYGQASGIDHRIEEIVVVFDEIQYLRDWEVHLKSAVDTYPNIKFVASGSAAAALRLKSEESGAGRFTDFLLPPLTFYEYLRLLEKTGLVETISDANNSPETGFRAPDIERLNDQFLEYLNFGGYPEVIFSERIRSDPARFIKSDIIDKVLLRDLPSLYGIGDIQELNYLFTTLAFNTANEISLGDLSQKSGVAKNTIKKYMEYLEAAFLIKIVHRIDHNARRFQRATHFKVYLTNPSMRAALFTPLREGDAATGPLTETAVFSQWFHSQTILHYARWPEGEIDIVRLGPGERPSWAVEVKWSDRHCDRLEELRSHLSFCRENGLAKMLVTTKTVAKVCEVDGVVVEFVPASLYCYRLGFKLVEGTGDPGNPTS